MLNTVLHLLKSHLQTKYTVKTWHCCDKGLTQEMVTTTAAVTSTMQIVEYHVKYNTTTNQTHLKQTTVVVGVRANLKKGLPSK
jgi:hypothetical protein